MLLKEYQDVFAKDDLDLGYFEAVQHRIHTGEARPIRQPPRRTLLGFQEDEETYLQQMIDAGIAHPSSSE